MAPLRTGTEPGTFPPREFVALSNQTLRMPDARSSLAAMMHVGVHLAVAMQREQGSVGANYGVQAKGGRLKTGEFEGDDLVQAGATKSGRAALPKVLMAQAHSDTSCGETCPRMRVRALSWSVASRLVSRFTGGFRISRRISTCQQGATRRSTTGSATLFDLTNCRSSLHDNSQRATAWHRASARYRRSQSAAL